MRCAAFLCLVALAGCGKVAQHSCDDGGCRGGVTTNRWDARAPRELDLLLVIACDDSGFDVTVDYDCYRPRGTVLELACSTQP